MLKVFIVEDEQESLELLKSLIEANRSAKVIGSTSNPENAGQLISSLNPDVVFLDIKMPGKSGFDILDEIIKTQLINPYIVFTTAFDEYAIRAFEYAAIDYLLKPIDPERLARTIERCQSGVKKDAMQNAKTLLGIFGKLIFRNLSGLVIIDPVEIVCIKAEGNYSDFRMSNGKTETITRSIGKIEEQLPADIFFRASRTNIINLNFLHKINSKKHECILHCNNTDYLCDISQDKMKILIEKLRKHG